MKSKAMFPLHPVCRSLPLLYILAHEKEVPQHSKFSNITGIWRTQRWKSSIFSSFFFTTRLQYSLFHACYTIHNWQVSIYLKLFLVGPFSFSVISNQILSAASFHHPSNLSLTIPASKQKELADLGTYQGNTDRSETNQGSLSCT